MPATVRALALAAVTTLSGLALAIALPAPAAAQENPAAAQAAYADMSGEALYRAACAACHGADGTGASAADVGFDIALPDFSECAFASREPDADWVAVGHEGGPTRGFDPMMPAFGDALTEAEIRRIVQYIRGFCGDADWPRGELNLPRALVTEKAYPEDEAVYTVGVSVDDPQAVSHEFVYERRFGSRNQVEVVVPFGFQERAVLAGDGTEISRDWVGGIEDIVIGLKRDVFHSFERRSIVSVAGEIKLPTGDEDDGFGTGTTVFESFLAYGQIFRNDVFLQAQGLVELPFDQDAADNEGALRLVLGRTFREGRWGRAWSPMLEVLAGRELEGGGSTDWDLVPQVQVTLNTRQHVMANAGVRIPLTDSDTRSTQLLVYVLWDWFDGGFFDGW
ncbi:MAG: c-type cytochrome [Gemmatimonadota bacterium]